jgi:3-phenylpropionate/cinnamic acid dioxygenase small subunit
MPVHDRFAAHEFINRYWFNYDEGYLDVIATMLAEDCHMRSRTETGQHPQEQFIASDNHGRDAALAWTKQHRQHSPYPLRHMAANVHVTAERDDEIDVESYLFVTQIIDRKPSTLSSGLVHWTLRLSDDGYRVKYKDVVLDSIESAAFETIPLVADRLARW